MTSSGLHLQKKTAVRQEWETETSYKKKKLNERGKGNCPPARESGASCMVHGPRSPSDETTHLHGDLGKCVILTSRGPVTSFLPITLYEVFITALSGSVE